MECMDPAIPPPVLPARVLVLTAYGTEEAANEAVGVGAADYLLKPRPLEDIEPFIASTLQTRDDTLRRLQSGRVTLSASEEP